MAMKAKSTKAMAMKANKKWQEEQRSTMKANRKKADNHKWFYYHEEINDSFILS